MLTGCWMVLSLSLSGAIPELSEAQEIQLETAEDGYLPDEPAWTGLLTSVATWDPAEAAGGFVPGATMPDFAKIVAEPSAYRGDLFVVEGKYAGRERAMRTQRAGPWGESLKEWGVVVSADAAGPEQDLVAVVYLVDPEGRITPPREGQTVRMLARFYKLWAEVDADGVERTYPVFVGRSASVVGNAVVAGRGNLLIVAGVGGLAGVLVLLMLVRKRRAVRVSRREAVFERLRRDVDETQAMDSASGLPDDPAAALEQLERSRDDV